MTSVIESEVKSVYEQTPFQQTREIHDMMIRAMSMIRINILKWVMGGDWQPPNGVRTVHSRQRPLRMISKLGSYRMRGKE